MNKNKATQNREYSHGCPNDVEMVKCPRCNHIIPKLNLELHQATVCGNHLRRSGSGRGAVSERPLQHQEATSQSHSQSRVESPLQSHSADSGGSFTVSSPPRSRARLSRDHRGRHSSNGHEQQHLGRRVDSSSTGRLKNDEDYQAQDDSEDDEDYVDEDEDDRSDAMEEDHQRGASVGRNSRESMNDAGQNEEIINLIDDDEDDDDDVVEAEWVCPRCTLLNPLNSHSCEVCHYSNVAQGTSARNNSAHANPDGVRNPDATRRERLINPSGFPTHSQQRFMMMELERQMAASASASAAQRGNYNNDNSNNNNPNGNGSGSMMRTVGGSALLGSAIGAISGLSRNRSFFESAMEGAVAGAVGGAISHRMSSPPTNNRNNNNTNENPNLSALGQSYRMRSGPGYRMVTVTRGTGAIPGMPMPMSPGMLTFMAGGGGDNGIDGMDYEGLLEAFGDGSENRGTDMGIIRSLPTIEIKDVERELPPDHRQCCICLDDFEKGRKRKTLPCLHGFHEECIDRWLKSSRNCPVCKFDLQGSS